MNYKNESLEQLIFEFLSRVEEATALLEKKFGTRCILGLWGANKIERCGVITGDITYELHGYGCAIYLPDARIDFDYGAGGRIDGFDAWRLYLYACEKPKTYGKYTELKLLEAEFDEYVLIGRLEKMSGSMDGLYVFRYGEIL